MDSQGSNPDAHKEGQAPYQVAAILVFLPLSLVAVILRVWVRKWMINCFGKDDIMMLLAFFAFCMYSSALLVVIYIYDNAQTLNYDTLKGAVYWTMVDEVFYLITMIFLKLSLGLFFLRIIPRKGLRRLIYATMTLSTVINTYHIFFVIFTCGNPYHYIHNLFRGECVSNNVILGLAYEQSAVTTVTDWVFAILPITILWNAKMDIRTKFVAGLILSLGALGSIASMIRFKYINGLAIREDFFENAATISIWSTIELGTGIVAGSLATLRPLFKKMFYKAKAITMTFRGFPTSVGPRKSKGNDNIKYINSRGRTKETSERPPLPRAKRSVDSSSSRNSVQPAAEGEGRIWDASHHSVHLASVLGAQEVGDAYEDPQNITLERGYDEERGLGLNLREEKRVHLIHVRDDASVHSGEPAMWSQEPRSSIQWPFNHTSPERGISKIVDVEVSTSWMEPGEEDPHFQGRTPDGSPNINVGRFSGVRLPERTARASMHSRKASLQRNPSQGSRRKPSPNRALSWFKSTPSSTATNAPNTTPSTIAAPTPLLHTASTPSAPTPTWTLNPSQPTPIKNTIMPFSPVTSSTGSPVQKPRRHVHGKASIDDIMMSATRSQATHSRNDSRDQSIPGGVLVSPLSSQASSMAPSVPLSPAKLEEWDKLPDLILQKSRTQSPTPSERWGMWRSKSRQ